MVGAGPLGPRPVTPRGTVYESSSGDRRVYLNSLDIPDDVLSHRTEPNWYFFDSAYAYTLSCQHVGVSGRHNFAPGRVENWEAVIRTMNGRAISIESGLWKGADPKNFEVWLREAINSGWRLKRRSGT